MMNNQQTITAVAHAWNTIETWAHEHFPKLQATFTNGATEDDLTALETFCQRPLPSSLRASLQRHNGQTSHPALFWYKDVYRLLSVAEIIDEANPKQKTTAIPIAIAGTGDKIWLTISEEDDPLRLRSHDDPHVPTISDSYLDWLRQLADDLSNGRYTIDRYGSLDRAVPDDDKLDTIIDQAITEVVAKDGDFPLLLQQIARAINQPEWIVTYKISERRLQRMFKKARKGS